MIDTRIIDGVAVAVRIRAGAAKASEALRNRYRLTPGLAVVLVGEDPASQVYVAAKSRETREAGMASFDYRLATDIDQQELLDLVTKLNGDSSVHGILVQMPLPRHIDTDMIIRAIDPAKDVDGLHPFNAGLLASGKPGLVPCTPQGAMILIAEHRASVSGLKALVIGRSILVGRPMAQLLLNADATVTMAHSRTANIDEEIADADILVAAVGRPEFIRGDAIKPGATVIDVGIVRIPAPERGEGKTRLVGDVSTAQAMGRAGAITPVPGGVGPMTRACLLLNTVRAACQQREIDPEAVGI